MKSSLFFTVDSKTSEYTLAQVRESVLQVPGIERVVALPDDGPNHLHLAVCADDADFDFIVRKVGEVPHIVSRERGKMV